MAKPQQPAAVSSRLGKNGVKEVKLVYCQYQTFCTSSEKLVPSGTMPKRTA